MLPDHLLQDEETWKISECCEQINAHMSYSRLRITVAGQMSFLLTSQHCQRSKGNSRHWHQPTSQCPHSSSYTRSHTKLEMWAQRDGRPAEYSPLFNAANFDWHPILECRAVMLPRCKTCWNLQGCPKLTKRSQPVVCRSSPYCGGHVNEILLLNKFFPIVLIAKI